MTVRYYISSADLAAEKFATAIRNHWHVENKLHWRLDVVMNEDDCKIRRGNAAELFSGIRHIAINILTKDKIFKAGLRRKMRKAAMGRDYLASVLAGCGLSQSCPGVLSFRSIIAEQKNEPEMTVRYYISSADLTAEKFAAAIRNHWHVENKLHWRLDVVMNEDDCKLRRGNAAELFSGIKGISPLIF